MAENVELLALTADIVAAHVSNNAVPGAEIGNLIGSVYGALTGLGGPAPISEPEKPKRAVSARASIKPGFLISMIDGKPYTMLKRHLSRSGHTPQSYREAYGLSPDYPMVAAEYAEKRRAIALSTGLGRKPKVVESPTPAKRGRRAKIAVDA